MVDGRMWHGGLAGLTVGELLLPPATTGNARQATGRDRIAREHPGLNLNAVTPDDLDPGWVHFTPHRNVALAYAGAAARDFGAGALYVVEPVGEVETDPDMPVQCLRARSATIVTVYDPHVTISPGRTARLHAAATAAERGVTRREQIRAMDQMVRNTHRRNANLRRGTPE